MKVKRQKHVRKVLNFYKTYFGLKPSYRILVDGTFCKAALRFKVNISEQLPKYLDAETNIYTTSCVLAECEAFGTILYGPLKVLKQFRVHNCHHKQPVPAANCIQSVAKKAVDRKFMIATQDQNLQERIRVRKGVPILYIAFNAINIEQPSEASKSSADQELSAKIAPSEHSQAILKQLKLEAFGEQTVEKKKHKKPKGPNPLSCKKKKKDVKKIEQSAVTKRKRSHKKNKIM